MCPGDLDAGGLGEPVQAAGGRVPVHPGAAGVEQDRPAVRVPAARSMARPTAGGSGTRTTLVPLPHTRSTRWPCSSPRSAISALVASKIRKPSRPSMATSAKSDGFGRLPGGGEQGLELQVREPQGRRFGGHRRAAHVLGG